MTSERESLTDARPHSWKCRRGKHKMVRESVGGNLTSHSTRARHTFTVTNVCARGCGHREVLEHFDRRGYWADVRRQQDDERLERIIRKATR